MSLPYPSYIICGSPRSGSTLLCEMLTASGVAGRPQSFYRQQSIAYWADRWALSYPEGLDDADFDRRYLAAMLHAGTAPNGIFGLRLMWASVAEASRRLDRAFGGTADVVARFEQAFGKPLFIHLSRNDKVAQAVSLLKAEQSGLWHLASDGSVMEGADALQPIAYDEARLAAIFDEREADDLAWENFFAAHGIAPLRLTYENLTAEPRQSLAAILKALGQDAAVADAVSVGTARMADSTSRQWADRFRQSRGR